MATHSSVFAWRIPGTGEPGGLPPMGFHRVRPDWSDLAAAAAAMVTKSRTRLSNWTELNWTKYVLKSGSGRPPTLLFFLKVALVTGVLWYFIWILVRCFHFFKKSLLKLMVLHLLRAMGIMGFLTVWNHLIYGCRMTFHLFVCNFFQLCFVFFSIQVFCLLG